jgi:hypothetical protein
MFETSVTLKAKFTGISWVRKEDDPFPEGFLEDEAEGELPTEAEVGFSTYLLGSDSEDFTIEVQDNGESELALAQNGELASLLLDEALESLGYQFDGQVEEAELLRLTFA